MNLTMGTTPFRWWQMDNWCAPVDLAAIPPPGDSVWEIEYANDCEMGKRTTRCLLPPWDAAVGSMLAPLHIQSWTMRLGVIVEPDPRSHGAGLHVTSPGGWLNCHLDYDLHPQDRTKRRALNLIAFLNPEWREEWGGALCLCDPLGAVVKRIYPAPGRLVAFECSDLSYHAVDPITGPVERVTAAVYLLAAATGAETRRRALFTPKRS